MATNLALLKLVDDDGNEHEINVRMRDVLQWEKRFRGRGLAMLEGNVHLEYFYELAFVIAQRQGIPGTANFGSPDDPSSFCGMYDIDKVEPSEESVDPTQPEASIGESSLSPSLPDSTLSTGNDGLTATSAP